MEIENIQKASINYQGSKISGAVDKKTENMNTETIDNTQENDTSIKRGFDLNVELGQRGVQDAEGMAQAEENYASTEAMRKAVEEINKNAKNSEAIFGFHDKTNRVTIKIVDKESKKVLKEYPPEKTLDMIAKAWELAGLMVDEKR